MTVPTAQRKAHELRTALHYSKHWERLRELGVKPAIVVTHEEIAELFCSSLFKFWIGVPTHAIIIQGIHVCEED
jgi:hypothetical protein